MWPHYRWQGRTIEYHRAQIRKLLGFREATVEDGEALTAWLCRTRSCPRPTPRSSPRARSWSVAGPCTSNRRRRSGSTAWCDRHCIPSRTRFCAATCKRLSPPVSRATGSVAAAGTVRGQVNRENRRSRAGPFSRGCSPIPAPPAWKASWRRSPNSTGSGRSACRSDLFDNVSPKVLQTYRRRLAAEAAYELRRHAAPLRLTLLAVFGYLRERELTDTLVDLLLSTVHRIGARAERRVEQELLEDLKRVAGKNGLLFQLAEAALAQPDGIVKDVVYPVVNEQTLRDLVKEWKATGPAYRKHVQTVIRNSYRIHYRRMVPPPAATPWTSAPTTTTHRPVLDALALLKKYADSKLTTYPPDEDVPVDGVVRGSWQQAVLEQDKDGAQRVNRINYEICVLQALRERLRCKEIWVVGADRYRNPDEDLPADFDAQRDRLLRRPRSSPRTPTPSSPRCGRR